MFTRYSNIWAKASPVRELLLHASQVTLAFGIVQASVTIPFALLHCVVPLESTVINFAPF